MYIENPFLSVFSVGIASIDCHGPSKSIISYAQFSFFTSMCISVGNRVGFSDKLSLCY